MNWPPLESDPEIFTNYFRSVGMSPNFRFDEIYTLDMELDCLAIIGAFRCVNIRDE